MNARERRSSSEGHREVPASVPGRHLQLIRPLLYALLIIGAIFTLYEVVERTWLSDVDSRTLHLLHIARGVVSSLVAAILVGWQILKASPGFLSVAPTEDWARQAHLTKEERTKIYAKWFIAMRWLAVIIAICLIVFTVRVAELLPIEVWWPLVGAVAILAAFNVACMMLVRWQRGGPTILHLQGYVDLAILTVLLHFSGGAENPLSSVMIFHVIIGGVLLSRSQCYGIAVTGSLLFALLIALEHTGLWEHYTLGIFPSGAGPEALMEPSQHSLLAISHASVQATILLLTAYFVTSLAERLSQNERHLKAMAAQARADHQLLQRALATTNTGLRVLNRDLQLYWASNRWKEWFECRPGGNDSGCELLHGKESPARQSLQDAQVRLTELTLNPVNCSSQLFESNRDERVFQVTTAPLLDVNGEISQVVELAQDVSQQKEAQSHMMRAGKFAAIGELAGQVAHEVNNPIAIILAKAKLLLSNHGDEMSPKIAQELGKIADLSQRVARIAQGLLSYCRPAVGARVPLNIKGAIHKSLAMVEQRARSLEVEIRDRLPDAIPAVKANANELEQVFLNLFLNALDAMPEGGSLTVSVRREPVRLPDGKTGIALLVEDTGEGVSRELLDRIFEPFFTTKQDGRGTGLGLSICLGLIRSHGGDLEARSRVGKGSQFIIKLPIADDEGENEHHG